MLGEAWNRWVHWNLLIVEQREKFLSLKVYLMVYKELQQATNMSEPQESEGHNLSWALKFDILWNVFWPFRVSN